MNYFSLLDFSVTRFLIRFGDWKIAERLQDDGACLELNFCSLERQLPTLRVSKLRPGLCGRHEGPKEASSQAVRFDAYIHTYCDVLWHVQSTSPEAVDTPSNTSMAPLGAFCKTLCSTTYLILTYWANKSSWVEEDHFEVFFQSLSNWFWVERGRLGLRNSQLSGLNIDSSDDAPGKQLACLHVCIVCTICTAHQHCIPARRQREVGDWWGAPVPSEVPKLL